MSELARQNKTQVAKLWKGLTDNICKQNITPYQTKTFLRRINFNILYASICLVKIF